MKAQSIFGNASSRVVQGVLLGAMNNMVMSEHGLILMLRARSAAMVMVMKLMI
jgi:hypothetical protein